MSTFVIHGSVQFQSLGTGFWGVIDEKGQKWRPINFPEQLKYNNAQVQLTVKKAKEEFSVFMWGSPVIVTGFSTVSLP